MREDIAKRFINDLEILGDIYGEDAIVAALEDLQKQYGVTSDPPLAENKNILLETAIGRAAGPLIPRLFGGAVGKRVDQDVNIAAQDDALEVESDTIERVMKQTNDLVNQTNQLLASLDAAVNSSNKNLDSLDYSIDDLISATTGKSVGDVRNAQASFAGTGRDSKMFPDDEERSQRA